MSADVEVKINTNLRAQIHAAAVQATREVFQNDILPLAKALSPVGAPPDDKHPGKNRDSIQIRVTDDPEKGTVKAVIFTESGYGWLLEHGTSRDRKLTRTKISKRHGRTASDDRTRKRPYISTAMDRFCKTIAARCREILGGSSEAAA